MKKQVKREEIISAAKKLIIQKGYRKTSVEDITTEVGVAKGSFYTYFKSKDSLMETLLSEKVEIREKQLENILKDSKSLDETIRKYVEHYLVVPIEDAEFILVMMTMMRSIDSIGEVVIKRMEKDKQKRKEEFAEILRKFKDEVDITEEKDYERYGYLSFGMINNFYINNFFPCENKFKQTNIEDLKNRISRVDYKYETEFMTKGLLKLIRKR